MPPVPPLASPDERPHGAKGRLRISGSPRERQTRLKAPFPGLSAAPQRPFRVWLDRYLRHDPESLEAVNSLFPQACVIMGGYPRANRTHIPRKTRANRTHNTSSKKFCRWRSRQSMSSWSEHFREQKQQAADSAIRNQAHFPLSLSGFSVLLTLCLGGGDRRLWAILRQNLWMESESACGPL